MEFISKQPSTRAEWFLEIKNKLNELTRLSIGWDGYMGCPVSRANARLTTQLLDCLYVDGMLLPSVVPGSDGSVQVEWYRNKCDIELDVLGPQNVVATMNDQLTGDTTEVEIVNDDFTQLVSWVSRIVN
jgi:hypothetical protein